MPRGSVARRSAAVGGNKARCVGETKAGAPCGAFALADGYCFVHGPSRAKAVKQAQAKGSKMAGQLRSIEGRRKTLDSAKALIKFTSDVVQDILAGTVSADVGRAVLYGTSVLRALVETGDHEKRIAALEADDQTVTPTGMQAWR